MPPSAYTPLRSFASFWAPRLPNINVPYICHSCLRRTAPAPPRRIQQVSHFHTSTPRSSDTLANHYETLHLTSNASPSEIKRQFYTLSKKNHPDHNRNDPDASTRFVAISEAYHVLSVPEKRAQYDAQLESAQRHSRRGRSWSDIPQGSHSSAAFGSRPASGLNKKRSTFRGPPPSFYKSGGYGKHGAKRAEHAYSSSHAEDAGAKDAGQESYGNYGGFGPGQQNQGNEVPHFNDRQHRETHENVSEHIWARRRRLHRAVKEEEEWERSNMIINFMLVSGIIGLIGLAAKNLSTRGDEQIKKKEPA